MTQMDIYNQLTKYTKQQLIDMIAKESAIQISTPSEVYKPILNKLDKLRVKEKEHFFCITLDGAHQIIDIHVVSIGLVNRTLVHPREVFRPAIKDNATAVIVGHNHPSGSLQPSDEDKDVTRRLRQAGDLVGIKVLDHIIVSPTKGFLSMLESSLF